MGIGKEIHNLPTGWASTTLRDILILEYGKNLVGKEREGDKFHVWGSNGVVGSHDKYSVEGPVIIIGRKGSVGKVNYSIDNCWPIDTTYYLKPVKSLNFFFIYYLLKSLNLENLDTSTTIPGLNRNNIYDRKIFLPSKLEQDRIVEKIEELFSELDSILNVLNELRYKIKVYWFSELKSYLKGDKTRRLNNQTVESILKKVQELRLEQNIRYKGETDNSNDNATNIDIPENWELIKLSDVFVNPVNSISDGPFGSNLKSSDFQKTGFPVLKIQNIDRNEFFTKDISFIAEEKLEKLKKHQFNSGDIILTKLGSPLGKACIVPQKFKLGVIVADLIRIKNNEFLNSKFLMYSLNSPYMISQMEKLSKGTTRQRVTLSDVRNLMFILPSIDEQEDIVIKIEELDDELRNLSSFIKRTVLEVGALKQKILSDAYSGNLVKNNNLADNSLQEYLLNIKIEKEKYINEQKEKTKLIPKIKKMKTNLDIEDILKANNEPITSFSLWQESKYKNNIEDFYKKLKELDTKINEFKEGHLSYIELVK